MVRPHDVVVTAGHVPPSAPPKATRGADSAHCQSRACTRRSERRPLPLADADSVTDRDADGLSSVCRTDADASTTTSPSTPSCVAISASPLADTRSARSTTSPASRRLTRMSNESTSAASRVTTRRSQRTQRASRHRYTSMVAPRCTDMPRRPLRPVESCVTARAVPSTRGPAWVTTRQPPPSAGRHDAKRTSPETRSERTTNCGVPSTDNDHEKSPLASSSIVVSERESQAASPASSHVSSCSCADARPSTVARRRWKATCTRPVRAWILICGRLMGRRHLSEYGCRSMVVLTSMAPVASSASTTTSCAASPCTMPDTAGRSSRSAAFHEHCTSMACRS
mmetsp:Transcript_2135/g.7003  ORF Transcript_2135/g.7003 Transcript_2135/m.7003 type:complete len:340 (+) Transcript_2135:380-1399(+)